MDAAWPEVKEGRWLPPPIRPKGLPNPAAQAARESVLVGAVVPGRGSPSPPPLEEERLIRPRAFSPSPAAGEWVNGPVEITATWEGDTIRVAEYAARPSKDSERMELRKTATTAYPAGP